LLETTEAACSCGDIFAKKCGQPPEGTAHTTWLAADFPYPGFTSLLRLITTEQHPQAGNGLLAVLRIPEGKNDAASARQALEWNKKELNSATWTHFLGSWVSKRGLAYSAFYPNLIHRIGGLRNIAMATVKRARWLTEEVMSYSWEEHFQEAVELKMPLVGLDPTAGKPKKKGLLGRVFRSRDEF
jgi:hypothetical protein